MRNAFFVVACAMLIGAAPTTHHAKGSFTVKLAPLAEDKGAGLDLGRLSLDKAWTGGLTGTSHGEMLSGMTKNGAPSAYVALERFTGSVDGKAGSFVFVHKGLMTATGGGELVIETAPQSGTGALKGIEGKLTIDMSGGGHAYDFTYTLP